MRTEIWSVQKAIVDRVNYESTKEWSKTPNPIPPKVELKPIVQNSPAWYVLINNMVRESKLLLNELNP